MLRCACLLSCISHPLHSLEPSVLLSVVPITSHGLLCEFPFASFDDDVMHMDLLSTTPGDDAAYPTPLPGGGESATGPLVGAAPSAGPGAGSGSATVEPTAVKQEPQAVAQAPVEHANNVGTYAP